MIRRGARDLWQYAGQMAHPSRDEENERIQITLVFSLVYVRYPVITIATVRHRSL